MIKIQPSGDYVQLIYVDPVGESVQQELKSDTDAFECSYDSEGKLFMQFGAMRFENPDPTDFTINGIAVTDAADFISKLNALFTGGGGGGPSLLPTTGTGTATGDIVGELGEHSVAITYNGDIWSLIDPENHTSDWYAWYKEGSDPIQLAGIEASNTISQSRLDLSATFDNNGVNKSADITLGANDNPSSSISYTAEHHNFNLSEFADNAAAVSGGLAAGDLYHTAGTVKIVTP